MATRYDIDHTVTLHKCLLQLVDTDTADVTFVVGPGTPHALESSRKNSATTAKCPTLNNDANVPHSPVTSVPPPPQRGPAFSGSVASSAQFSEAGGRRGGSLGDSRMPGAGEESLLGNHYGNGIDRFKPPFVRDGEPSSCEMFLSGPSDIAPSSNQLQAPAVRATTATDGDIALDDVSRGLNRNTSEETLTGQGEAAGLRASRQGGHAGQGSPPSPRATEASRRQRGTGEVREFRCHRVLFASCSEYFRVLLYGGMSESQTRLVELTDVAVEGFEAIMTYVYTGKVQVTADTAMDIFSLAHRFALADLLRDCARVLNECMTCSDVCRVLEAAMYFDHAELVAKCWDLIKEETPRVLKSESFLELSLPLVKVFVREGDLQVDEADLFKAVQAWVERDPHERRMCVDQLSPHFRLPLISLRDLMSVVRPSNLIPAEALLDAVTYHSDPPKWSGEPLMARPRGKKFTWDSSSLAAGAWMADKDRTVTTSVADWVGVYGNRVIRAGFHRWSIRASKLGRLEHKKKPDWKAVVGIARPRSQDLARPFLPVTGFVVGTGDCKLGGNTAVDDYASVSLRDGDVLTVVYDADAGVLSFLLNDASLGEAYSNLTAPRVAALAIHSAGAMWSLEGDG